MNPPVSSVYICIEESCFIFLVTEVASQHGKRKCDSACMLSAKSKLYPINESHLPNPSQNVFLFPLECHMTNCNMVWLWVHLVVGQPAALSDPIAFMISDREVIKIDICSFSNKLSYHDVTVDCQVLLQRSHAPILLQGTLLLL